MARRYHLGFWRRLVNRLAAFTARRGWGRSWLLTTRGRRSGLLRTTPVTPIQVDGQKYLVAPYGEVGWVRNARHDKSVTLTRGSVTERHFAVEVEADEAAPVLAAYLAQVKVVGPYFDVTAAAPLEDIAAEADRHPVFRLDPIF